MNHLEFTYIATLPMTALSEALTLASPQVPETAASDVQRGPWHIAGPRLFWERGLQHEHKRADFHMFVRP
jgi:hypothetical protein